MTLNCPFCRQAMQQPVYPVLPNAEMAIYSIIVQNGSRGVHKFRILELLVSQHGFDINQAKLRKLIYNMNHKSLYKLEQWIAADRHSGIYALYIEGKKYGETAEEPAQGADHPPSTANQNQEQ